MERGLRRIPLRRVRWALLSGAWSYVLWGLQTIQITRGDYSSSRGCASTWRERAQPLGWELSIKDSKIVDELRLEPSFAGFNWGFWGYGDAGVPACFDAALTRYWDSEPFLGRWDCGSTCTAFDAVHVFFSGGGGDIRHDFDGFGCGWFDWRLRTRWRPSVCAVFPSWRVFSALVVPLRPSSAGPAMWKVNYSTRRVFTALVVPSRPSSAGPVEWDLFGNFSSSRVFAALGVPVRPSSADPVEWDAWLLLWIAQLLISGTA